MNKKGMRVMGMPLEWVIIIVALIFGTVAIMIYIKQPTSSWIPFT